MIRLRPLLLAGLALALSSAHAGGPLGICNSAPLKYAAPGTVNLNYDGGGTLGTRTKAQADAIVTTAASMWTNVSTATVTLGRGADLPVDVTQANYSTYYSSSSDGLNPVVYDTDGAIIDALLGTGNKSSVLGFAGSSWFGAPTCRYAEGRAVINGFIGVSDATMTNVLAHELGHLIGLDHTQLDSSQGLTGANYPLMYPIAYRTTASLHEDDASAVSALYPDATVASAYGTLAGNFRLADGITAVLGANIWARENTSGKLYSAGSDYLMQGNGAFRMLVPPGTYTLRAEAVDSQFDGGSSVGQYADVYPTSPSFQPPLYTGSTPMAPVTMGNASPTQITIVAGCTSAVDFRINGGGGVSGNCGGVTVAPARITNLSTRMQVLSGNDVLIGGFIIGGATAKTVAIVATGPSLTAFGIANALANPALTLVRSSDQSIIATNDNWQTAANAAQLITAGFAPTNPLESAILVTLAPGAYSAIVSGAGGVTGVGVVAVYEVDHPETPLVNLSTRGQVRTGNDVMIGGFIVQGTAPRTVAIVATGPSLAAFGIANPLANPTLTLVRSSDQAVMATNDNWQSGANAAQLQAAGLAPGNPLEAAILMSLAPGAYSAILSGAGGGIGTGVIGVYTVN